MRGILQKHAKPNYVVAGDSSFALKCNKMHSYENAACLPLTLLQPNSHKFGERLLAFCEKHINFVQFICGRIFEKSTVNSVLLFRYCQLLVGIKNSTTPGP